MAYTVTQDFSGGVSQEGRRLHRAILRHVIEAGADSGADY